MKIIGTIGLGVMTSLALLQPAEGSSRAGGGRSFSSGGHFSASSARFSSPARSFSSGGGRHYAPSSRYYSGTAFRNRSNRSYAYSRSSPRYSSQARYRNRMDSRPQAVGANRTASFNRRTGSDANARMTPNRRNGFRSESFKNNGTRVAGSHTRHWNRNRDHNWNGNRCRWKNNAWVIVGPWYPWWGYGYYPYGSYYYDDYYDRGYYDGAYYDDGYGANQYSEYGDQGASVSQVQSALSREGYYSGPVDGSLGPATRSALRQYQRDHGLAVTGRIDRAVVEALRLQ